METKWKGIYSQKYAAEIEKLRAKQPKGGRPPKLSKPTQSIASVSKDERTTDAIRAKAAGTNRTYVRDMEKIAAEHPNDVLETCRQRAKERQAEAGPSEGKGKKTTGSGNVSLTGQRSRDEVGEMFGVKGVVKALFS